MEIEDSMNQILQQLHDEEAQPAAVVSQVVVKQEEPSRAEGLMYKKNL